jgi:SagB-type dehydrogenase family enzyme
MEHIRLNSPFLREPERTPAPFIYKHLGTEYLPEPAPLPSPPLFEALSRRKSRREGLRPSRKDIAQLLWHSARTLSTTREESGFLWQHRPAPSGGGRHPVDLLVCSSLTHPALELYDPMAHCLCKLEVVDQASLIQFVTEVDAVVPVGDATILWFVAQFDRTMSKYQNGESLVWLDAGALLATVYLVAEALGLACCAVGITGAPWVTQALGGEDRLDGLCGFLVWGCTK